ncbi:hypothetical protein ACLQ28_27530 [Micromonospora sp. DT201]|uniref:hypothetical protein n=1 Tax=Micromonospora sp. DT201 TaxID=3393442 RepID=UPI003CF7D4EF
MPAPPYRRRPPPPARLAATRPALRDLVRLPTRPAARPGPARQRLPPAHPWAHRPRKPRPVVVRTPLFRPVDVQTLPPNPVDVQTLLFRPVDVRRLLFRPVVVRRLAYPVGIRTRRHRCAARTLALRAVDPARSPPSPAGHYRPPMARPLVDVPPDRQPIRHGLPGPLPPPARPASTARRLAP